MSVFHKIAFVILSCLFLPTISIATAVTWDVSTGPAQVVEGQTHQPIIVTWTNPTAGPISLSGTVRVVDYYMCTLGEAGLPATVPPGESVKTIITIPTDQAGPYVKVRLEGTEGAQPAAVAVFDEQLVFTEVLTGPRLRMSLNGPWEMNKGDGTWEACELPYRWDTWTGWHRRQFRKRFVLPEQMKGRRIELQLSGVRFHVKVSLNGTVLAEEHTDQMPLTVNLSSAAKPGSENEIVLEITDWLSCASPEEQPELWKVWSSAWYQGREIPGMPFIRPATCGLGAAGIADPIYIVATESQAVQDVFVTPSVRQSQLSVGVELRNDENAPRDVSVRMSVMDGDKTIVQALMISEKIAPGITKLRENIPFDPKAVQLWWPWKPKLYRLQVELLEHDKLVDRYNVRFGIREFRCDGEVFRINEVPIRPAAFAAIPNDYPAFANYDEKSSLKNWNIGKEFLRSFQNIHVNLLRFHTEPFPILMFDQADEVGLMVVSEAWMATLPGKMKLSDKRTWRAMHEFYPKWVRREFNHPCLVIRSMENELGYHLPGKDEPRSQWGYSNAVVENIVKQMRFLGRLVQKLDPSRPIMYEGSGTVFYDVADIYNLHYPGTTAGTDIGPLEARRFSIPIPSYREKAWLWDRKKPLYVGEYDCCYSYPEYYVPFLGDDAYVTAYLLPAEAALFSLSVPGHRIDGVTAGFPHNPLTFNVTPRIIDPNTNWLLGIFARLYSPIATFIHQYRICYYGGTNVTRTVTTLNDTLESQEITIQWSLTGPEGKVFLQDHKTMTLTPAQSERTQIPLSFPAVDTPTECTFTVETLTAGSVKHTDTRKFILYPEIKPTQPLHARYGLVGVPAEPLQARGANVKVLTAADLDLKDIDVLIVSGAEKELEPQAQKIDEFLKQGGRMIVFADKDVPTFLPVKLELPETYSPLTYADDANPGKTFTVPAPGSSIAILYPRVPSHPVLANLGKEQLRYWRESHLIADYTWKKPKDFSAWSLAEGSYGFRHSALLEIPEGKGMILATTLPVLESLKDQPAAAMLLDNLLVYVDGYVGKEAPQAVGVLADDDGAMDMVLQELGVKSYVLSGKLSQLKNLSAYGVIVVGAGEKPLEELKANQDKVRQFVRDGGVVWLQGPTPEQAGTISELLGKTITITPLDLASPIRMQNRSLLAGVTNDDVYWPDGAFLPPASKSIAKNTVHVEGASPDEMLATPEIAAAIADGKGYWLLDEIAWPGEMTNRQRALQYVRAILPSVGLQVRRSKQITKRPFDPSLGYEPVDISPFCNEGLRAGIWNGPERGIHGLPIGDHVFGEYLYQIIDPKTNKQKACISFYSEMQNKGGVKNVTIPVGKKAACIRLLLTSVWTGTLTSGTKLLDVDIEYADGSHKTTEVCYGRDALDWCTTPLGAARTHPRTVWVGEEWPEPGLFDFAWINPEPEKEIRSITFRATHDTGCAVLFAITAQQKLSPAETKASNWIPGLEQ